MKLIKITNKGSLHFRLSDGRLGVCYESGYVRVSTKRKTELSGKLYQINKLNKVKTKNSYYYKRTLVPTQYDRVNMLINFNNNNCI